MNIGIYARGLSIREGGVQVYIRSMTQSIIRHLDACDHVYIFHSLGDRIFHDPNERVSEIILKAQNILIADYFEAPQRINALPLDVMWFPKNVIPFFVQHKTIVTFHDLGYLLWRRDIYPFLNSIYMRFMMQYAAHRANRIITVSENTQRDTVKHFGTDKTRISVIPEAVDNKFGERLSEDNLKCVQEKYTLPEKFLLLTGGLNSRKNIGRLVRAFKKISQTIPDIHLVITGEKEWK
ncbi:glycosyltransferase, partial [Candidatus Omnitrophota bacterium]